MSITKTKRPKKQQLGQFITPYHIADRLVSDLVFTREDRVLEPSMGNGSFIIPIIEKFMALYHGDVKLRLSKVLSRNVYGVEIDAVAYEACLNRIKDRWGNIPPQHNLVNGDFFRCHFLLGNGKNAGESRSYFVKFSYVIGNPPFGGTLDPAIQDSLDREFGFRNGKKIKKETYAFFIVKSMDLLRPDGQLIFICSDTFLTINTMNGLRRLLMSQGSVRVTDLPHFSEETSHPMIVLRFSKDGFSDKLHINGQCLMRQDIDLTDNFSWRIRPELSKYFSGPRLGQFMVGTSGMTVGRNRYFVREIQEGRILEPYRFEFYEDRITLEKEIAKARLGYLPPGKIQKIKEMESAGITCRNVRIITRDKPVEIEIPNSDYCHYNKGCRNIVYAAPKHVIYWKDEGDAVMTFKKNGNWYLRGAGGRPFFKREGLTWQLIAQRLHIRYLPEGFILDSGSPCAFLREGGEQNEFYFIFGWTLTALCNYLLKEVINHTKNIQSKDFERLPYPYWVSGEKKSNVVAMVRRSIEKAMNGQLFNREDEEILWLEEQFTYPDKIVHANFCKRSEGVSLSLF